jgi:geranylgeranyl diphosphate synthase, type II
MSLSYKGEEAVLIPYRKQVEEGLVAAISAMGEKTRLRDAIEYALFSGGKRFRPMIVLMIGEALQCGWSLMHSALAVEFFHTASLIADDLPCMDNDDQRRDYPSLHKKFGESISILASYTLISHGYEEIYKNTQTLKQKGILKSDEIGSMALHTVARCAGIFGATNGQFLDLYPPDFSQKTVQKIIEQKTVTLFEISFVLGWLYGGGNLSHLETVRSSAYHFGMAFQIADDFADLCQDLPKENDVNIVSSLGVEAGLELFQKELALFEEKMKDLNLFTPPFRIFSDILSKMALRSAKEAEKFSGLFK